MKYYEITEGIITDPKLKKLYALLEAYAHFTSLKTMHLSKYAADPTGAAELKAMETQFSQPVFQGMRFSELVAKTDHWKNPKVIPGLLKYIYQGIQYIEPRIKKFVRANDQASFLKGLENIKALYKEVVAQYS